MKLTLVSTMAIDYPSLGTSATLLARRARAGVATHICASLLEA